MGYASAYCRIFAGPVALYWKGTALNAEPIISVSGLRGIVGETLTPDVAIRYACAFAAQIADGPIVVTRDGRATGRMVADAGAGRTLCGGPRRDRRRHRRDSDHRGPGPSAQAAGGIQISASHNPPEYNGLKLFGADGRVISEAAGQPVLEAYRSRQPAALGRTRPAGTRPPCATTRSATTPRWCWPRSMSPAIRDRRFQVLLDSNHGAGSLLGRLLLEQLGCQVTLAGNAGGRSVRTHARTDGREPGRRSADQVRQARSRRRLLPGPGRRSAGADRRDGPLRAARNIRWP